MKLSRAFNGFDETYAINDSNGHDLGPTSYLSSKKDVVVQLLRTKVAELKNIKVSRRASLNACSSQLKESFSDGFHGRLFAKHISFLARKFHSLTFF